MIGLIAGTSIVLGPKDVVSDGIVGGHRPGMAVQIVIYKSERGNSVYYTCSVMLILSKEEKAVYQRGKSTYKGMLCVTFTVFNLGMSKEKREFVKRGWNVLS